MVTFVDNANVNKNVPALLIKSLYSFLNKFIQKADFTWMFRLTFGL